MRAIKATGFSLLLAASLAGAAAAETAADFLQKGSEARASGNLRAAAFFMERACEADPSNLPAYKKLAEVLIEKHDYGEALAVLNHISKLTPKDADNWAKMAELSAKVDDYEAAVERYSRALQLAPGNTRYLAARGVIELDSGMYRNALDDFNAVLKVKPDAYIYFCRARLRSKFSQNDAALADVNEAIKNNSKLVDAYALRADLLRDSGHNELSVADMKTYETLRIEQAKQQAAKH